MDDLILMIPGPVWVRPEVLQIMSSAPWGHRDKIATTERLEPIRADLKKLLLISGDQYEILVSTSSATGLMESVYRCLVSDDEQAVNISVGAFGDLWFEIGKSCGKKVENLRFEYGEHTDPNKIEDRLRRKDVRLLTVTHNETSTGVTNPLADIAELAQKYNALLAVDAVTSMAGIPIETEQWGLDLVLASSQKCFGLPPGLAVGAVSRRALEKAQSIPARGTYLDLVTFAKSIGKNQTPSTPNEAVIDALAYQLDYIMNDEGLENRFQRHVQLGERVRDWAVSVGMTTFPRKEYASNTVSCLRHDEGLDKAALKKALRDKGYLFDGGYRKLADEGIPTFRIPTMGDMTLEMLNTYLKTIEELL